MNRGWTATNYIQLVYFDVNGKVRYFWHAYGCRYKNNILKVPQKDSQKREALRIAKSDCRKEAKADEDASELR